MIRLNFPLKALFGAIAASCCLHSPVAYAVEGSLEEIVVTATRRDTALQDTPVTISVVSEQEIISLGANGLGAIVYQTPGINVNGTAFTIRGMGSSMNTQLGGDITYTNYLDEIPGANIHYYDVSQVEVLRGPQGTLFGTGSMAGVVRVVTNKPDTQEFDFNIETDYSQTSHGGDNYEINAMMNIPIIEDQLALRAVLYRIDTGGWVDNVRLNKKDQNDSEREGGRVALRWQPSQDLDITASYIFQNTDSDGASFGDNGFDTFEQDKPFFEKFDSESKLTNVTVKWDLPLAEMVFSQTYSEGGRNSTTDATDLLLGRINGGLQLNLGLPFAPYGEGTQIFQAVDHHTPRANISELRFVSKGDNTVDWIVGAFYAEAETRLNDGDIFINEVNPETPALGVPFGTLQTQIAAPLNLPAEVLQPFIDAPNLVADQAYSNSNREKAVFGELTWHVNDKLDLIAGIRYLEVSRKNSTYEVSPGFGILPNFAAFADGVTRAESSSSDHYTKFKFTYQLNEDVLIYGSRAEGFRQGGTNNSAAIVADIPDGFDSDIVTSWELGTKSSWLDGRLYVNGALFYNDWEDIRVRVNNGQGTAFTTNGPAADITGLELSVQYFASKNLRVNLSATYLVAELAEEEVDPNSNASLPNSLTLAPKGEDLPGTPRQTYSVKIDYDMPGLIGGYNGYASFNASYTGSSDSAYVEGRFSSGRVSLDSYMLSGIRLGLRNEDWNFAIYAKNLLDEDGVIGADRGGLGKQFLYRPTPRRVGMTVRRNF